MLFILVISWIACAYFSAQVAYEKGYNTINWCIFGFLFGFFALVAAADLPDKKLRKYIRKIGEKQKAIDPADALDDFSEEQKEINKINKKYDNFWDRGER